MLSAFLTLFALAQAGVGGAPAAAQPEPAAAVAESAETQAAGAEAAAAGVEAGQPTDPGAEQLAFTDVEPASFWMPEQANVSANDVDWLFYGILGLSVFCFTAISICVVFFTWKYRHRPGGKALPSSHHSDVLEITWTVIPSLICVVIFIFGWRGFVDLQTPPKHAMEVGVTAQKWAWNFRYQHGQDAVIRPELHIPVDTPVRVIMRSEDVLHAFYVPVFRVKQDIIPNRYTKLWFEATKPGVYRLYCAEYCGTGHSDMKTRVVVHESGGYEKWIEAEYQKDQKDCAEEAGAEAQSKCYEEQGLRLYEARGCKQCHSTDGSPSTGPTYKGMWGEARQFTDGTSGVVDENYIRESLLEPHAKVRAGYSAVMPTFKGKLTDKQIDSLINWMKTL